MLADILEWSFSIADYKSTILDTGKSGITAVETAIIKPQETKKVMKQDNISNTVLYKYLFCKSLKKFY